MELIAKADVVLALGTRLNPFSTLPGYGIDYWPKDAKVIQVDINPDRIGLTKKVTVGIEGDATKVAEQPSSPAVRRRRRRRPRGPRKAAIADQVRWAAGTCPHGSRGRRSRHHLERACPRARAGRMSPRMAWRAIQSALPKEAIISSDIGNNCAIGNAYPTFEQGRKYLAPGLFGPCGYGFPAILGAKIASPTPVVGFAGDGAFGISMNEMTAIGRE
jgi:sulfoacetaldehyde acetyltransferase